MASPKVPNTKVPNAKIRIEDVITKDGKFESDKFWKLTDVQIADLIGDAVHNVRTYIMQPSTHKEAAASVRLLEALDKENPDLGLSHYVTLFKSIESGNGSALTRSYFDSLKQYDPDTFNLYLKHPGWEAYDRPDFDFTMYRAENAPKDVEPSAGALTDKPINNASSVETPPGALTNPPKLPEVSVSPEVGKTIGEAEANAYTGNEHPIADYDTPITSPGVHVSFIDAEGKPVDLTSEEITKFKPNSASPSPEVKTTGVKETPKAEAVTGEAEAKTPPEAPETPKKGVLTGEDKKSEELSKGMFSKIGGHLGRNWGKYGLGITGLGWVINDLASDDSTLKSWFTRNKLKLNANNSSGSQPRVKSLDQREGAYMPERLLRFRQNTQDPFISNTDVNVDIGDTLVNEELPVQQQPQQQVVSTSAPVNNATADYVRSAYRSYIPSDAGRAYQKAIYGDPLELERNRLQQQQQKWRDFVIRSGQSPAELVQRGLMPYDALQYI